MSRLGLFVLVVSPGAWIYTSLKVADTLYTSTENLPERQTGLLLWTSQYNVLGGENLFFTTRIEATKILYEQGKIKHILISGDNSDVRYNEPESMRRALIKWWIPSEAITLDYAGFRTLDSIIRARDIFGLTSFTIISQTFHTERALFLAQSHGIDAIWYGAADISLARGFWVYIREIGARWVALWDVIIGTEPKFLGETEFIPISPGKP